MTRKETVNLTDATAIKEIRQDDIIIALIGPYGSGKTHLINVLAHREGKTTPPGKGLAAKGIRDVHAVRVKHKIYGDRIVLLDTPGFESGHNGDIAFVQVEQKIKQWVQKHCNGVALTGIVYLQQISNSQSPPSRVEFMYKDLCGSGPMCRIILATTMWHETRQEAGERQHKEISRSWNSLTKSESSVHSFSDVSNPDDQRQKAWDLILPLIKKHNERDAFLLRQELDEMKNELCKTEDGKKSWALLEEIMETSLQIQRELSRLELTRHLATELKREEKRMEDAMRYLRNRFRGGSGDHSILLTRLISLISHE